MCIYGEVIAPVAEDGETKWSLGKQQKTAWAYSW